MASYYTMHTIDVDVPIKFPIEITDLTHVLWISCRIREVYCFYPHSQSITIMLTHEKNVVVS